MTSKEKIEEMHNFFDKIANKLGTLDYLCYQHYLDDIEKDLEDKEYAIRQNEDFWKTIKAFSNNAIIDKNRYGISIKISINNYDSDFNDVAWVFGCQRR